MGTDLESSKFYFAGSNLESFSIPSQAPRCLTLSGSLQGQTTGAGHTSG